MIGIDEAERLLLEYQLQGKVVDCSPEEAVGLVLAEDATACSPSPRFTSSSMDGFAVRAEDTVAARSTDPVCLTILGESRAGFPSNEKLQRGFAQRVNTGAVMPEGADAVIPRENVRVSSQEVLEISTPVSAGAWVRMVGIEFSVGAMLFPVGTSISPAHLGVLLSAGCRSVRVRRAPRVCVIVTGSELVDSSTPEELLKPGQIRDCNGPILAKWIEEQTGHQPVLRRVDDQPGALERVLQDTDGDIVLVSGSMSVGDHDWGAQATVAAGYELIFHRVAQKPGKPFLFARREGTVLFGLPGNPLAVALCTNHYVVPYICRFLGAEPSLNHNTAIWADAGRNSEPRARFLLVELVRSEPVGSEPVGNECLKIRPSSAQESHMLLGLARAWGYVRVAAESSWEAGEQVRVRRLGHR